MHNQRGQAAPEFALVLTVLSFVMMLSLTVLAKAPPAFVNTVQGALTQEFKTDSIECHVIGIDPRSNFPVTDCGPVTQE